MSSCAGLDTARLSILLDLRNPGSYLALSPALAFANELRLQINWLPITVPPLRRPSVPKPDDDRGTLHRCHRARAIAREIEIYGRAQGLVLRELYRDPDASAFNLGWLWLRERSVERLPAFLLEGFRAYWSLDLDPSSVGVIVALLDSVGAESARFEGWCAEDGPRTAARVADEIRERGVFGAPGYFVEGEFFQGRQHLPMIRWILGGRRGPGPI
jgi:2-hydroxychromene-2-carboxylate isomerase